MKCYAIVGLLLSSLINNYVFSEPAGLRDKIGQMLIIGFDGKEINQTSLITKQLSEDNLGGVILFDYNPKTKKLDKNIESPTQVRQLTLDLQQYNRKAQDRFQRAKLPLLISVDYEGGQVTRLSTNKGFPETFSAAAIGQMTVEQANQAANAMASTLEAGGFNLNFAPVLDVNTNPDNPIIGKKERSFSADPGVVASYSSLFSSEYLQHNIQCAYKHFPGHGSSTGDSHLGFVDVSNTWESTELIPYQQLIGSEQGCGMIMTAHLVNRQLDESGLPATLSHKILTGLLRNTLNFKGVIVTDDMQMKAISEQYSLEDAITLAINAGADMMVFGNQLSDTPIDPEEIIDLVEAKVQSGEISEQRIDEAYQRIVALKQTLKN